MSEAIKYEQESQISEYEQVAARMKERDKFLTRRLRQMRIVVRILDVGFGISSVALMSFTLHKYYTTINVTADGQALWEPPSDTVLWPSYLTLVGAVITSLIAAVVLIAYYWSVEAADRIDDWRSRLIWLVFILKIVLEITTSSTMYATGTRAPENGPQSLWFQTCTMPSETVSLFNFTINLNQFCSMQKWGSVSAVLSIVLDILSSVTFIYWFLHWRHGKQMKRHLSNNPESRSGKVDQD